MRGRESTEIIIIKKSKFENIFEIIFVESKG